MRLRERIDFASLFPYLSATNKRTRESREYDCKGNLYTRILYIKSCMYVLHGYISKCVFVNCRGRARTRIKQSHIIIHKEKYKTKTNEKKKKNENNRRK